jgi:GT2 family glycosyltransferase
MADLSPSVAVVVPVHNGLELTRRCLELLAAQKPAGFETILVDDGSTDGTAELVGSEHPDVTVLHGNGSLWWSGAVNVGCRHAIERGADVVVLFNNDNVECSAGAVSHLAGLARATGDCVSPVALVDPQGGARAILHAGGSLDWAGRGHQLRETGTSFVADDCVEECDWLPGTALAIRADVFTALGGADAQRFPQYRGDIDLTLRARGRGRRCLVLRDVWVLNDKTQTGFRFDAPLSLGKVAAGLVSLRSPYNLGEALRFAARHCPPRLVARYLALYYARYFYACLKANHPGVVRLRDLVERSHRRPVRPA